MILRESQKLNYGQYFELQRTCRQQLTFDHYRFFYLILDEVQYFLEIYDIFVVGRGGATLPDDSMVLLGSASSLVEDVGRRLKNAEIDVKTLRIVQKNRGIFLKLHYMLSDVEESQSKDAKPGASKMGGTSGKQQGTGSMELFLEMRIEELKAFEKERDAVFSFVEMCSAIKSGESLTKHIPETKISSHSLLISRWGLGSGFSLKVCGLSLNLIFYMCKKIA